MAKEGMITPQPLMGRINRISRCFTLYRNNQLEQEGLNGYQHLYICLLYTSTGMAVIFAEVGQEVHINGSFEEAVQEGVRRGYTEGLLRCSVVKDPIRRGNTGAVSYTHLSGDYSGGPGALRICRPYSRTAGI